MEKLGRFKVFITCKQCGERFILRGKGNHEGKGKLGTGFKQCVCNNDAHFFVRTEEI